MAYLQSSGGEPIPSDVIRELAEMHGLTIPDEDLEALSSALRDQLASVRVLEDLDLRDVAPILRFDPQWHD